MYVHIYNMNQATQLYLALFYCNYVEVSLPKVPRGKSKGLPDMLMSEECILLNLIKVAT